MPNLVAVQVDPFDEIRAQCEPEVSDTAADDSALVAIMFQKVCFPRHDPLCVCAWARARAWAPS